MEIAYLIITLNVTTASILFSLFVHRLLSKNFFLLVIASAIIALITAELFANTNPDFNRNILYICSIIISVVSSFALCALVLLIKRLIKNGKPFITVLGYRTPLDERTGLIFSLLLVIVFITQVMGSFKIVGVDLVTNSFYSSWVQDVIFFSIMGLAVALVTLRLPHHEDFVTRLSFLFPMSKSETLEEISDEIKAIGYIAQHIQRSIEFKEYSQKYQAYRVSVIVNTSFSNLFGDIDAKAVAKIGFTPDNFTDLGSDAPDPIGCYTSICFGDEPDRLNHAVKLGSDKLSLDQKFTVGRDGVHVVTQYWCWLRTNEIMSFNPSRFVERHVTKVYNRMEDHSDPVNYEIYRSNEWTRQELNYGACGIVSDTAKLKRGSRLPLLRLPQPGGGKAKGQKR